MNKLASLFANYLDRDPNPSLISRFCISPSISSFLFLSSLPPSSFFLFPRCYVAYVCFLRKLSTLVQRRFSPLSKKLFKPFPIFHLFHSFAHFVAVSDVLPEVSLDSRRERAEGECRGKSATTERTEEERKRKTKGEQQGETATIVRQRERRGREGTKRNADESFGTVVRRSWPRKSVASSS